MSEKTYLEINLKKVIHAPRWRVVRMLTKVWEWPYYVPIVKEVKVVEKNIHGIRTSWKVNIEGIPISWIEEDTIDFSKNVIRFKAVGGDLSDFRGSWHFQEHPQGTEVLLAVYFNVNIPILSDIAETHIRDLLTKTFSGILDSLEQRLISNRYASFQSGQTDKVAGFAILGHPYNINQLTKNMKMVNPNADLPSLEFLSEMFKLTPAYRWHEIKDFTSATGAKTHGSFILCTFIPDMIEQNIEYVYSKVVAACRMAEKSGTGIATLGGLASVVAERFGDKIKKDVDIPITSGNTYTVALAVDGVEKAAELLGVDLSQSRVAIIGGTGDIGTGCARILAPKVKHLTITGRTGSTLRKIKNELRQLGAAKIEATKNNKKAIKQADIVIAAANSSASILEIEWFKPGAIVCDLGYPKNLSYKANREDIFVFSGGLAKVPSPVDTGVDVGIPSGDFCYGCFCEAIILALERRYESYSFGRGQIRPEKVNEIRAMALKHGFTLAPFVWANKEFDSEQIAHIREAALNAH